LLVLTKLFELAERGYRTFHVCVAAH